MARAAIPRMRPPRKAGAAAACVAPTGTVVVPRLMMCRAPSVTPATPAAEGADGVHRVVRGGGQTRWGWLDLPGCIPKSLTEHKMSRADCTDKSVLTPG